MEICERKKKEFKILKDYYTENYENIIRSKKMLSHFNGKTKEEVKNLVCNFDNPDDVREMEKLTHALNLHDTYSKIIKKQLLHLQELKKYIDLKEEKSNEFLDLIKPKIYKDEYSDNSIGYNRVI